MKHLSFLSLALAAVSAHAGVVGQWQFNGDLSAEIGSALTSHGQVSFETSEIGGRTAQVARFTRSAFAPDSPWFRVPNPIGGNGGGTFTNQYSVIMDVFFPTGGFQSLLQTAATPNANDGDWFLRSDNGLGITGDYTDALNTTRFNPGAWNRIALVIDTTSPAASQTLTVYRSYVNGVLQNVVASPSGWGRDGRFSLGANFHLFADNDNELRDFGLINSLQLRNYAMSGAEVAALGGPTVEGVPEPASMLALGAGAALLAARRRRR